MKPNNRRHIKTLSENCSGCRLCELVCSDRHNPNRTNPKRSRIRVAIEHRENKNQPRVCLQCEEHPCLEACPADAIKIQRDLGIPVVSPEECTGCQNCVSACPYGAMFFDAERNVALKCDLCGGDPECVKNCPMGAIVFEKSA
jgi:Fe-S-cluster-containing hydrogenase component 2